jgi:hypothetical protein
MENQEKLTRHIERLAVSGQIIISRLDWTQEFDIDLHDYLVTYADPITKETFEGRGTDSDADKALIKAYAESVERYIMSQQDELISTNGCAVHTDIAQAMLNARKELIERDLFSLCFLYNIKRTQLKTVIGNSSIQNLIDSRKDKIIQYQVFSDFCMTATMILTRSGFLMGLGCDIDPKKSAEHSLIESTRQYVHTVVYNNKTEISLDEFKHKNELTYCDHGNLAFNKEYIRRTRTFFARKPSSVPDLKYTVDFNYVEYKHPLLTDSGLHFIRCQSPSLIELPIGPYNLTALQTQRVTDLELNVPAANKLFHFIR